MVKIEIGCFSLLEAPVVILSLGTNDSANRLEDCGGLNGLKGSKVGSLAGDMFIGVAGAVLVFCFCGLARVFNKGIDGVFNC